MIALNFNQYIFDYYIPKIRNPKLVEFTQLLISPIVRQYDEFYKYYNDLKFIYSHNGQRMSLEHLLNNKIDIISKAIKIIDGKTSAKYYIPKDIIPQDIEDTFDYQSQVITYKPLRPTIGKNVSVPINRKLIISKGEINKDYYCDMIVLVGNNDYSDSNKLQMIKTYLLKFVPAGTSYQIKPY